MFRSLAGRTVIVTGGSRGIGRGLVKRFAEVGANVLVVSRHLEQAETLASVLGSNVSAFGKIKKK